MYPSPLRVTLEKQQLQLNREQHPTEHLGRPTLSFYLLTTLLSTILFMTELCT